MNYMESSKLQKDWDTNHGWWTDKPERTVHRSSTERHLPAEKNGDRVWSEAALVVGLALSLVLSIVSLATR